MSAQNNGCYHTAISSIPNGASNPIVMPYPVDIVPALFRNNPPPHTFYQNSTPVSPKKCNKTGYKTLSQTGKIN